MPHSNHAGVSTAGAPEEDTVLLGTGEEVVVESPTVTRIEKPENEGSEAVSVGSNSSPSERTSGETPKRNGNGKPTPKRARTTESRS